LELALKIEVVQNFKAGFQVVLEQVHIITPFVDYSSVDP